MTIAPEQRRTVNDLPNPIPGWRWLAVCRIADPDVFVSKRGGGNTQALAYCSGCPVIDSCLVDAVRHDDQAMIRGGKSPLQRTKWLAAQGIRRPPVISTASQKAQKHGTRRLPIDVPRVVELHDRRGQTFKAIAESMGYTERTVARRYAEWKRQQQAGEAL